MVRRSPLGRWPTAALSLSVLTTACAQPVARSPFEGPSAHSLPVKAEVDNGLTEDVGVYAVQGSSRFRVGTVNSLSKRTLTIPPSFVGPGQELRLLAEPLASRTRYMTQGLLISAGSRIEWSIIPGLQASQAHVRH